MTPEERIKCGVCDELIGMHFRVLLSGPNMGGNEVVAAWVHFPRCYEAWRDVVIEICTEEGTPVPEFPGMRIYGREP